MIESIKNHCKKGVTLPVEFLNSLKQFFVEKDGVVIFKMDKEERSNQVFFNGSYETLLNALEYTPTFSKIEMFEICSKLFTIMFEYRLLTSGTGFESRFKTPERMSDKLSSFWYSKQTPSMTVPAEIHEYYESGRRDVTIPVSLSYDIIFNEAFSGIQNTFHIPTKFTSIGWDEKVHQELIIDVRKIHDDFYYQIKIIQFGDRNRSKQLFKASRTCNNFDDFINELTYSMKRELFNVNYKAQYEAYTGTSIDFDQFDVANINMLFDMTKI